MEVMYDRCCGIDVHKKLIVACFKCGKKQEIRKTGTTSDEIRELSKWLLDGGCQIIAMESTGSYWKPLYNIFELLGLDVIVANARDIKNVPGRKTDVVDAEWIADLLRHGLIRASYIPSREQRELREMSRYRQSLIGERSREIAIYYMLKDNQEFRDLGEPRRHPVPPPFQNSARLLLPNTPAGRPSSGKIWQNRASSSLPRSQSSSGSQPFQRFAAAPRSSSKYDRSRRNHGFMIPSQGASVNTPRLTNPRSSTAAAASSAVFGPPYCNRDPL